MILAALLLALCLGSYALFLRGDLLDRAVRAGFVDGSRSACFAVWCAKAVVLFGLIGAGALLPIGRGGALVSLPREFGEARAFTVGLIGDGRGFPIGLMLGAMAGGGIVGELIGWLRRRRKPFMLGDIGVMMPRSAGELWWGGALSVIAGVVEEIFFRLTVPLLTALLTGSAAIGFAASLVLFALAHRYQGWLGVGATAAVGGLMTALYLSSGELWLAMLIHGFIDLNGLVIRPMLRRALPERA